MTQLITGYQVPVGRENQKLNHQKPLFCRHNMQTETEIEEPKKKSGPASEFTEEIFAEICERMAEGQGLRKICSDPDMPSRSTFLRLIENDTGRQAKYQRARESLMDWYAEDIIDIAWDESRDTIKGK